MTLPRILDVTYNEYQDNDQSGYINDVGCLSALAVRSTNSINDGAEINRRLAGESESVVVHGTYEYRCLCYT